MIETTHSRIHTLELGPMENFIYLIEDKVSQRAAVVDPAWDAEAIVGLAKQHALHISDILLTHSHHDHVNAATAVQDEFDAQLHLTHAEAKHWGRDSADTAQICGHYGGDILTIGSTDIHILHTPGHTPGSACYHVEDQLMTGDTMFVFGCGRCDLAGGDPNVMFDTLNKLRRDMPKDTQILPGHNYAVKPTLSMGEQITGNPFMHFDQQADFVKFRMQLHGKVRQQPYQAVDVQCAHEWLTA